MNQKVTVQVKVTSVNDPVLLIERRKQDVLRRLAILVDILQYVIRRP